jgi:hypothetical protein
LAASRSPPREHWSPRFLPLVERHGSARVYEVGLAAIGWPPTIDQTAGRTIISLSEFDQISEKLKGLEK